ncbi:MAG: hypothetical protein WB760_13545 [Xanthobacteraceae bacterium]
MAAKDKARPAGDDEPSTLEAFEMNRRQADRELAKLQQDARVAAARLMQAAGSPINRRDIDAWTKAQKKDDANIVLTTVIVPKAFKFRHDDGELIDVPAGTHAVPTEVASHWWFAANGVKPSDAA